MSSIIIAENIIKRLFKQITIIVFLLVFPLIAALLGWLMNDNLAALSVGIVNDDATEAIYHDFSPLEEYNTVKISASEAEYLLENNMITMAILPGTDGFKYEIVSRNGGPDVDNLKNQLIHYSNHSTVYSLRKENKNPNFSIGIYLLFMMMFVGSSSSILLTDRAKKTYMRLFCYPTSAKGIVLGYILAILVMGIVQISFFLFFTKVVLEVGIAANFWELFIVLVAFLLATIGLTLGLTSIATKKDTFTVIMPIIALFSTMLSGSIIPTAVMGNAIVQISHFLPQTYVVKSLSQLAEGGDIASIAPNIGILLLFTLVFFSFGTKVLDKELL